ncbi:MAG: hypothetical protein ACRER1_05615 [Gammaproteobacteria bacterium]
MNHATPLLRARGTSSLIVLLLLVLAISAQLVTGFTLMARPNGALLIAHIAGGIAAVVLTLAEWLWLTATHAGRHRLAGFLGADSGPAEWSEAAFLIVATVTVLFGALLVAVMYLGLQLPFGPLFGIHRALAIAVAVLYLAHTALSMRRACRRRAQRMV